MVNELLTNDNNDFEALSGDKNEISEPKSKRVYKPRAKKTNTADETSSSSVENPEASKVRTRKPRVSKKTTEKSDDSSSMEDVPQSFSADYNDDNESSTQELSYTFTNVYSHKEPEEWMPSVNNTQQNSVAESVFTDNISAATSEKSTTVDRQQYQNRERSNPRFQRNPNQRTNRPDNRESRVDNRESNPENRNNRNQRNDRNNDRPERNERNSDQNNRNQNRNNDNRRFTKQLRIGTFSSGMLKGLECFDSISNLENLYIASVDESRERLNFSDLYEKSANEIFGMLRKECPELPSELASNKSKLIEILMEKAAEEKSAIVVSGVLESIEGGDGLIVYPNDNYRIRPQSAFVPKIFIRTYGLRRGQNLTCAILPPTQNSTCPYVVKIFDVLGKSPAEAAGLPKFKDLTPYYPTERLFLETKGATTWDNNSMRIVDILTPIGLGQRGLIVAPPRTGKTVLLQGIANSISHNRPDVKLIILLIDERPEEVTDFRRQVKNAEIISSTFDESSDNHVHAADMAIDNARRCVEAGQHVVILLDSITRLARAHNTEQPSSGKLLSGGVDANALQAPKKFFGSARNIEGGGSLTILATALIETGSRMDDVIFEEFKGTGNMELHLDRAITEKRIFPGINWEKSGTRKEELLYHPDEMEKIYAMRRAMNGVQSADAIEMILKKIQSTKNNTEFLLGINR